MDRAEIDENFQKLLARLTETQHQTALGHDLGRLPFDVSEKIKTTLIGGSAAHLPVEPRHRLHVVVVNLRACGQDAVNGVVIAQEVGRENFNSRSRACAYGHDTTVEMIR